MWCPKCDQDGKPMGICPVSLGLSIGIVSFFVVLLWTVWAMTYGMPAMMVAMHMPAPTLGGGLVHSLLALIKGFVIGFFIALLYDVISCCMTCKKSRKKK